MLASARYHGGSDYEFAERMVVDPDGYAYVLARTFSADLDPAVTPVAESAGERATALFLLKLAPDGQPVYAVTIATGFSYSAEDLAVGRDGSVHVLARRGDTAHIVKIDGAAGQRVYAVTYDAFAPNGISPKAIAADDAGRAIVAGWSGPASGMFVAWLDGRGSVFDMRVFRVSALVRDVAVDGAGAAYVTGVVASGDFPTTAGSLQQRYNGGDCREVFPSIGGGPAAVSPCPDAFLMKVRNTGDVAYATYFGGTGWDEASSVAVDDSGAAVIAGLTRSPNLPILHAVQPQCKTGFSPLTCGDAFVARIDPAGAALVYSTFLGGTDAEGVTAVSVDRTGTAYLSGTITGSGLPIARGPQVVNGGGDDGFAVALAPSGDLLWSTYLGGEADDRAVGVGVGGSVVQVAGESMSAAWLPGGFRGARDLFSARVLDPAR